MKIKKYTNYVSPVIGFIIMLFVAITAIDSPDWLLPRLYLFFALDWRMISLGIFILPIITWVLEIILHYYDQKRKNPTEIA